MSASGMAVAGTWMLDKRATELNNGMPEVSASAHVGLVKHSAECLLFVRLWSGGFAARRGYATPGRPEPLMG